MSASFLAWSGIRRTTTTTPRPLLTTDAWPSAVYAVGDIHGCLSELKALEDLIVADGAAIEGIKWIVYLGDYVDRGPDSAGVLDHLLARPPTGFIRKFLAGNHEVMMLEFLADLPRSGDWLQYGGLNTLQSYGIDLDRFQRASRRARLEMLEGTIPSEHRDFLAGCALGLRLPSVTFVHAGLRPGVPFAHQREQDLLWIREEFFSATWPGEELIVHGHTPSQEPRIATGRLGIDTGAFATGRLTAVRLVEGKQPHFVYFSSR